MWNCLTCVWFTIMDYLQSKYKCNPLLWYGFLLIHTCSPFTALFLDLRNPCLANFPQIPEKVYNNFRAAASIDAREGKKCSFSKTLFCPSTQLSILFVGPVEFTTFLRNKSALFYMQKCAEISTSNILIVYNKLIQTSGSLF